LIHEYFHGKRMKVLGKYIGEKADLDLGAGKKSKGRITVDILPRLRPDVVAEITHIPLRDGCVKSVVSSHVIEHVENPAAAMTEVRRVLAEDGWAFFFLPDDSSRVWRIIEPIWAAYYGRFVIKEASPESHLSSFSFKSFSDLVGNNFGQVVKVGKLNFGMEIYAVCRK
jgi:SAM-dependent methyltransferase